MCELHKQARIRHFVVSAENITVNLKAGEFWEEKACSLRDCIMCKPEECPGSPRISGFLPQFEHLSISKPSNANPPPMSITDFESYESLPVVDDTGENQNSLCDKQVLENKYSPMVATVDAAFRLIWGEAVTHHLKSVERHFWFRETSSDWWVCIIMKTLVISPKSCDALGNGIYDESLQSCCYQCPSGSVKQKACSTNPDRDCWQCRPEYFLNREPRKPRCEACVSCKPELDLVEKAPCSNNSSRVCECRTGLFCMVVVRNSCARCVAHTVCKPGFGVLVRGTSKVDVSCEKCPPGTFSDRSSSTEFCKPHTDCAKLNKLVMDSGNSTHDQVCMDSPPTHLTPATLSAKFSNEPKESDGASEPPLSDQPRTMGGHADQLASTKPVTRTSFLMRDAASGDASLTAGGTIGGSGTNYAAGTSPTSDTSTGKTAKKGDRNFVPQGAVVLSMIVLLAGMLAVWQRKVFKRWIFTANGKASGLYPVTTCRPRSASQGSDLMKNCAKRFSMLKADKESEERELINRIPLVETNNNLVSSTEKNHSPDSSLAETIQSTGNATDYPVDSRVRDHTNNRIDKIYIMKADTVIVGSVSEVPVGKNCAVRGCENDVEAQENMEEKELVMHYPQQETESFPGSNVMISVEEEGKEFHHPTTATEK
ncbi:tumor necrosis factor receptor superfamily member 8 [Emydura macquarii macquarii]|uniref:tumor necrosis factor receptor superfamily member 8 n=1 Tax=Emydura macquarii macquarii TaxID=1129001 RepID=UPI00352B6D88